jgi:hypothetical protein
MATATVPSSSVPAASAPAVTPLVVSIPIFAVMVVPVVVMPTIPVVIFVFIVKPDPIVPARSDPNHLGFFIVIVSGFDINANSDTGYFW